MAGLIEFRAHAVRALRLGEWATSELAINALLGECSKVDGFSKAWCDDVVKLFYGADFARLADFIEYEMPVRFVTKEDSCPAPGTTT